LDKDLFGPLELIASAIIAFLFYRFGHQSFIYSYIGVLLGMIIANLVEMRFGKRGCNVFFIGCLVWFFLV